MASITKQANGRREIQVVGPDGKRRTIRLGRVDQKTADTIRIRVEEMNAARVTGDSISISTSQWLNTISAQLHDRFVRAGLCAPRALKVESELTLQTMLDAFVERRDDVKTATRLIYRQAQGHLQRHLGADGLIRSISVADATDYRRAMRKEYSEAYTAKMIVQARLFWRDAVDRGLVDANVFTKVPSGSQVNIANQRYVERSSIDKVIGVCPDPQWKLLIALSRYAGLRCPSEHLVLKWSDIDLNAGRMTVRACKTEHHADKGIRIVPIFTELRPYLVAVHAQRDVQNEHVITRYRGTNTNLRTQFIRYIEKAGLKPWPRLFHNLRASCQTDLTERFPSHVVCEWIGNSEAVARAHYLQTTDAHFVKAAGIEKGTSDAPQKSDANSDAVKSGNGSQEVATTSTDMQKIREILRIATGCNAVQSEKWAIQATNTPAKALKKRQLPIWAAQNQAHSIPIWCI